MSMALKKSQSPKSKSIQLDETWLKASILGATWAASEIILGSFLHNLKMPFKGNILTAIGVILLVSASYKWPEKGLFWRSGLICALMKTMSPSAVILGPMIAIFFESLLLEISVRILGRNFAGFFLGSAMAMSWNFLQKIINMIIFYGFNIVVLYSQTMEYARKQLKIQRDLVWTPILLLLFLYILFGAFTAFITIRTGKKIATDAGPIPIDHNNEKSTFSVKAQSTFPHSIRWLIADFVLLIFVLFLINTAHFLVYSISTVVTIVLWSFRYKRGIRRLLKPSFWIFFFIITMLSAFILNSVNGKKAEWMTGVIIGLQMNFRAAILMMGFSALGIELFNPKIRNFFARTSFQKLPSALETSFGLLPRIIEDLPGIKTIIKNPTGVIKFLIQRAEKEFFRAKSRVIPASRVLITGEMAQGKTTFAEKLVELLVKDGINVGGFYSPRVMNGKNTIGYDLVNVQTREKIPFLRETESNPDIGKYSYDRESMEKASLWGREAVANGARVIIIDEVGRWELSGKGWRKLMEEVAFHPAQIWVVRKDLVQDVIRVWGLGHPFICDVGMMAPESVLQYIKKIIGGKNDTL